MDFQYHGVEHGWGLSLDYVFKYFVLGFNYNWGETNDYIKTNNGMEYYVGGNYRYHIVKQFYVEGRMLAGWYNWNTKIKTGKSSSDEVNTNKAFIGINPRIGLDFDGWGISAGYRWDYVDFKFDKDHKFDRFTIGISIGI
jgi:hypothetical protein